MKKIIIYILLLSWSIYANAQLSNGNRMKLADSIKINNKLKASGSADLAPQVVPSSPQSAIFEKYLNHQITEYNGLPDISIPLYEIEIKGLKIPIALTYHASGIKYKQFDGEVGAGWSIGAGGYRVSRTVNGRADDLCDFYNQTDFRNYVELNPNNEVKNAYLGLISPDTDNRGTIIGRGGFSSGDNSLLDGEYDQFNYMLPSTNGHFIITNRNTRSVFIAEQNRDIINLNNGALENIEIKDESGFQYKLGESYSSNYSEYPTTSGPLSIYATSWLLKQIVSPYNENVEFKYQKRMINLLQYDNKESMNISDSYAFENFAAEKKYWDMDNGEESSCTFEKGVPFYQYSLFIEEIKTDKETITFFRNPNEHLLRKISIKDKAGNIIREIEFLYVKTGYHDLMTNVLIKNGSIAKKQYNLEYYAGAVNTAADQWGYYTGVGALGDLFLHDNFMDDQIKIREKLKPLSSAVVNRFVWANRENTSQRIPNDYSLKKITYPTGGSTEYSYESNQYKDEGQIVYGGGLRIGKITSDPGNGNPKIITKFKYGQNEDGNGIINFNTNISSFYFAKEKFYLDFISLSGSPLRYLVQSAAKIYSTYPVIPEFSDFVVNYDKVSIIQCNEGETVINGKTVSRYEIPVQYEINTMGEGGSVPPVGYPAYKRYGDYGIDVYHWGSKPILLSKCFLKNDIDTLCTENYAYNPISSQVYKGLKIYQPITTGNYNRIPHYGGADQERDIYEIVDYLFRWMSYEIIPEAKLLSSKVVRTFTPQGKIEMKEIYDYNTKNQLMRTTKSCSEPGKSNVEEYTYPWDNSQMVSRNIISPIVKKVTKSNSLEISREETTYPVSPINGMILPASIQISFKGGPLSTELTYNQYDSKGNIQQLTDKSGASVVYLWGYNYQYPIAEIKGASYSQVVGAISGGEGTITSLASSSTPDMSKVNDLRSSFLLPKDAQVTTYTYKPLVGVQTITNSRGACIYYEYDDFGRLKVIRDDNGSSNGSKNVLEKYEYNYKNN